MGFLWVVKLWWLWLLVGLYMLVTSVLPPGISIVGAVIGGTLTLLGAVMGRAMRTEGFRNRINRNL